MESKRCVRSPSVFITPGTYFNAFTISFVSIKGKHLPIFSKLKIDFALPNALAQSSSDKKERLHWSGCNFHHQDHSRRDHGLWTFSNLSQIMVSFTADPLLCPKNMIDVFSTMATVRHLSLFKDDTVCCELIAFFVYQNQNQWIHYCLSEIMDVF